MKLLTVLVLAFSVAVLPSEAKVEQMADYYKILSFMYSESCPAPGGSAGLEIFRGELEDCYKLRKIPEPEGMILTGVPIGLGLRAFPGEYITASSSRDEFSGPDRGRLDINQEGDLNGAWCSELNNELQFFEVDLGGVSSITGIITQGGGMKWVNSYTLEISLDGIHWGCVFGSDGRVKVYIANDDSDTSITNMMNPFIATRYIRLIPRSWTNHICMRVEIYVETIVDREPGADPIEYEDLEAEILHVNVKGPKTLVVRSDGHNQIDTGIIPEEWTEQRAAPPKSISFQEDPTKFQPDLFQIQQSGVSGIPLNPGRKLPPLIILGGGPVVDIIGPVVPNFFLVPVEVSTFGNNRPVGDFTFDWYPAYDDVNMYIEFSFGFPVYIKGLSTTGRPDFGHWVTWYKLQYWQPHLNKWVWLEDVSQEGLRIKGNTDDTSERDHIYEPAMFTARFRLYVLDWEVKPAMTIKLYLGSEMRQAVQIVTGPVIIGNVMQWTWKDEEAQEGMTQEIYFEQAIAFEAFTLGLSSNILEYKLQYFIVKDHWVNFVNVDGSEYYSRDSPVRSDGLEILGLRIIATSFEGNNMYGEFNLEFEGDGTSIIVQDILELTSNYVSYKWEDDNPASGSSLVFNLGSVQQLSRIETKGLNGAWASSYLLTCRLHSPEIGVTLELEGNDNDEDIVEHIITDMPCRYVIITPTYSRGIGMEVFLFTDGELDRDRVSASVDIPGTAGQFSGQWSPQSFGNEPYLEMVSDHHFYPTSISLSAFQGSSVLSFQLQKKSDKNDVYESVIDIDGQVKTFSLGDNEFKVPFKVIALRILPKVPENNEGGIGFSWTLHFTAEHRIDITPSVFSGAAGNGGDGSGEGETGPATAVLSGTYSDERIDIDIVHYIRFEFETPVRIQSFGLKKKEDGSSIYINSFKLEYKLVGDAEFRTVYISEKGEVVEGNENGAVSYNIGEDIGEDIIEFKMTVEKHSGPEVKFEYTLGLSGQIGDFRVIRANVDRPAT